jgi:hypothetical protein
MTSEQHRIEDYPGWAGEELFIFDLEDLDGLS